MNQTDKRLLIRILENILTNPDNDKFKSLRMKKLDQLFSNKQICLDLLYDTGFYMSKDQKRLIFDSSQYNKLQPIYDYLSTNSRSSVTEVAKSENKMSKSNRQRSHQFNILIDIDLKAPDPNSVFTSFKSSTKALYPPCELSLSECLCLKIVIKALNLYNLFIFSQTDPNNHNQTLDIYDDIYSKIGNDYNDTDLLDDFNHLLLNHKNEFQDVYNIINHTIYNNHGCNLSKCIFIKRNCRNREQITKNENLLQKLYFDSDNIVSQQLLDRIHCYFLHQFDIGYRDSRKELHTSHKQENYTKSNSIEQKTSMHPNVKALTKTNKFSSDTMNEYSNGYRYYYWKLYKNRLWYHDQACGYSKSTFSQHCHNDGDVLKSWYIDPKYSDIREELLLNSLCGIGKIQMESLLIKAALTIDTETVRTLFCARTESAKYYDMTYEDMMTIKHLVALMVYCGYDKIQYTFSKTFRKKHENESDFDLRERHRNYYWLGRLLRECVECFGMRWPFKRDVTEWDILLYRGVSKQFKFPSIRAYMRCPVSMSREYSVAANFCNNTGMIIELRINGHNWSHHTENYDALSRITCFDCEWISDFPAEQEILTIGGLYPFRINNIIDVACNVNYEFYIQGLEHLTMGLSNDGGFALMEFMLQKVPQTRDQKQMLFRLLSHAVWKCDPEFANAHEFKGCPEYIKDLLELQCKEIKCGVIYESGTEIFDVYFKDDHGWINLELLLKVFPNIENIVYKWNHPNMQNPSYFVQNTLSFMKQNADTNLKGLFISIEAKYASNIEMVVEKYKKEFGKMMWMVCVFSQSRNEMNMQQIDEMNAKWGKNLHKFRMVNKTGECFVLIFKIWNKCIYQKDIFASAFIAGRQIGERNNRLIMEMFQQYYNYSKT